MKKLYSLIRACMTSDMNIFKVNQKHATGFKKIFIPVFLSLAFMFAIWSNAHLIFEKVAPMHLQYIVLSLFVFITSIMTLIEGVYKSGPLLFNCKDDQLLLSLPIKRSTIVFVRVFKFYIFELLFNSLFIIPLIAAYLRWAESIEWTFFLTSFVMIILLPIIPIVISCIIGVIISSLASRFKFKNFIQIVSTMLVLLLVLLISYYMDNFYEYVAKHATSINDMISKIYYPAGVYANLVTNFNIKDLLVFIAINIGLFALLIFVLSKVYFKINSRLKSIATTKKLKISSIVIKSKSASMSLIKKELNMFFKIPVFIINAGFGLVLFLIMSIYTSIKYDNVLSIYKEAFRTNTLNQTSLIILLLLLFASFMTSITNSLISLEGRNINILKSLPVKTKTILMAKIYACLIITTPILLLGDIILFVRLKIKLIEMILLLLLSVLVPLVSHFIGLIINLKFPKLDAENSTEVVKQSTSSFISVMLGMLLLLGNIMLIIKMIKALSISLILLILTGAYIIIDLCLYLYLSYKSVEDFNSLSV